jgi:protein tyrosine phosphatase (PTP) superfamily phosphohydrolase (DUF442 family)
VGEWGTTMPVITKIKMAVLLIVLGCCELSASDLSEITNYREYDPMFSSSGQPSAKQMTLLSEAGFKRVIYIAFSDNKTAIKAEDRVVKSLGMDYLHIPVDFDHPTQDDFEDFAAVMNRDKELRTLLHCQVNFRASTFSFLYRVIYSGVAIAEAKSDLDEIWQPDKVWYQFIIDVLGHHQISHQCDSCDWGANEFLEN